jgi:tetratricopeptide (TPR) repeat protein
MMHARRLPIAALQAVLLVAAGCSAPMDEPATAPRADEPRERIVTTAPERIELREAASADASFDESERVSLTSIAPDAEPEVVAETASDDARPAVDPAEASRLGREAWQRGEYDEAVRALRVAIDDEGVAPYDVYLLGLALWRSGLASQAETYLVEATWQLGSFARAPLNLARVRLELDDVPGAREAVDTALAIDAELSEAHNVLGRVLLAQGDRDAAAEAFQRASELDPANPWPLNNLGYALLVSGGQDEAVAPLERAVEVDPSLAVAWHNLALAREQVGRLADAAEAAVRAGELAPEHPTYEATLARLGEIAPGLPGSSRDGGFALATLENDADASAQADSVADAGTGEAADASLP